MTMLDKRLLVVDDDATTRFALHSLFTRQGWKVAVANPHCMILDLNLPDGRGESVLRAVRESHLPTDVAVCSGVEDPGRLSTVLAMHPDAMLAKPLELGSILHFCQSSVMHP
jgi:DNA-binding response OmpR family regulator